MMPLIMTKITIVLQIYDIFMTVILQSDFLVVGLLSRVHKPFDYWVFSCFEIVF